MAIYSGHLATEKNTLNPNVPKPGSECTYEGLFLVESGMSPVTVFDPIPTLADGRYRALA